MRNLGSTRGALTVPCCGGLFSVLFRTWLEEKERKEEKEMELEEMSFSVLAGCRGLFPSHLPDSLRVASGRTQQAFSCVCPQAPLFFPTSHMGLIKALTFPSNPFVSLQLVVKTFLLK